MKLLLIYLSRGFSLSGEQTVILLAIILLVLCVIFKISSKKTKKLREELESMREEYKRKGLEFIDPYGSTIYSGFINKNTDYYAYLLLFRDRIIFEILEEKKEVLFKYVKECRCLTLEEAKEKGLLNSSNISEENKEKKVIYLKLDSEKNLLFQVNMEVGTENFYRELCDLINENNKSAIVVKIFEED